jgi:hypothetical protein
MPKQVWSSTLSLPPEFLLKSLILRYRTESKAALEFIHMQLREDIAKEPKPEEEGDGNEPSRAMESVAVVKRAPITSVVMKRVPSLHSSYKESQQQTWCTGSLIFALGIVVYESWNAGRAMNVYQSPRFAYTVQHVPAVVRSTDARHCDLCMSVNVSSDADVG